MKDQNQNNKKQRCKPVFEFDYDAMPISRFQAQVEVENREKIMAIENDVPRKDTVLLIIVGENSFLEEFPFIEHYFHKNMFSINLKRHQN